MGKNTATNYFDAILQPGKQTTTERKVWAIGLETVIVPFLTAKNAEGKANIPNDALGYPLRLSRDKDGTVKFSKSGKPVIKVNKVISDQVKIIRENFTASLITETDRIRTEHKDAFNAQVSANYKAGKPVMEKDERDLAKANDERLNADLAAMADMEPTVAKSEAMV